MNDPSCNFQPRERKYIYLAGGGAVDRETCYFPPAEFKQMEGNLKCRAIYPRV